jgi:hypothetical protein
MAGFTKYTTAKGDAICAMIAGGESVRAIGKQKTMPSEGTIYKWLGEQPEFSEKYARAREQQADVYSQQIVDIADDAKAEDYNVAKIRIDARKWAASKLAPKKYGDKVRNELTGADGGPVEHRIDAVAEVDKLLDRLGDG